MVASHSPSSVFLICSSGTRLYALPIGHVIETMRPLPAQTIPDMPSFMLGVSIIRGATAPVVHIARLMGDMAETPITRFVTIRLDKRIVALAIDRVVGIRSLDAQVMVDVPLLLQAVDSSRVAAIGILDAELLLVLQSTHVVSDAVWATLDTQALPT